MSCEVDECMPLALGFGDNRKSNLQDIAILTGGTLISEDIGTKLEDVTIDMLGTAKRVTISKDDTIILDGAGGKETIEVGGLIDNKGFRV